MKTILFVTLLIAAVFGVSTVTAQVQVRSAKRENPAAIKERMVNTQGLIDIIKQDRGAIVSDTPLVRSRGGRFGPGEHPVFLLQANLDFVRFNETLDLHLVSMINSNKTYEINVMVLRPGQEGEYDGTQPPAYFSADNDNYGEVVGLHPFTSVKLYSRTFNNEDPVGRYSFSIAIFDAATGALEQQIIYETYLLNSGQFSPNFFVKSVQASNDAMTLNGKFQAGQPVFYQINVPGGGSILSGPDPRYVPVSDGSTLTLPIGTTVSKVIAIDVYMWSPYSRYAITKSRAAVIEPPGQ